MKPGSGDTSPAPVEVSQEIDASGPGALSTPFAIGSVAIPNRVVLAPMAGLTTSAYRRHLKLTAPAW